MEDATEFVHVYPTGDVPDTKHCVDPTLRPVKRSLEACWLCQQGVCVQRLDDEHDNLIFHGTWGDN